MKATPRNPFRVNSSPAEDQQNPTIAIDERGNFVVAWQSSSENDGEEIFARFFLPGGAALAPEFLVNTFQAGDQTRPAIGTDAIGNVVTAWQSQNQGNTSSGIFAQRYQFAGDSFLPNGSEFRVNSILEGTQRNPDIAFNPLTADQEGRAIREPGSFVAVWQSEGPTTNTIIGRDDSGFGIFAQRYNSLGTPQGRAFLVNTAIEGDQINPAVAKDGNGNFVVVWQSRNRNRGFDIFGQRYDNLGNPIGIQFQVNNFTSGNQINPDVAVDPRGNFVIVWQDGGRDGDGSGIFARRYNVRGNPLGAGDLRVNSTTSGDQETPSIGSDAQGRFTIVWASDRGGNFNVIGQQFGANGRRIESEFQVNRNTDNDQTRPQIAVRSNGNFVIAWQGDRGGDEGTEILARRYTVLQTRPANGGNGNGNGSGNGSDPVRPPRSRLLRATAESDLIVGTMGDDLLSGGKGNDRLMGKAGRNQFVIGKELGREIILDFQPGRDELVLSGDLQPADLTFVPRGSNTLVQTDDRTLAVLRGVSLIAAEPIA